MKKLFLFAALCVAATFSACSHDDAETPDLPDEQPLAIAFAEGNSLQFDAGETKTVHYTITGGSDKTVVKAEMQKSDDAYTIETAPTSATEGTITITAKTPTDNCVLVTVSDGDRSITAEIAVSTNAIPEKEELAITFTEGNSLELGVNENKTIHYTITGGSDNTIVTAEMQTSDDAYTVETTLISATEGTIAITATMPTDNCIVVTVSDEDRSITAIIDVTLKAFDGKTAVVETPGTLAQLLTDHDESTITELTFIGNLNDEDIAVLKNLPNLAILDMENVDLDVLPYQAFQDKTSLTSVKLPRTLKTIGYHAFNGCTGLTNVTIPDSVTSIGGYAFQYCSSLTTITIPDSVTEIGLSAFSGCRSLTGIIIPNSVTKIRDTAFSYCSRLTSVTIGNSVTSIGDSAFANCSGLTAFYGKFASSDNRCLIVDGCLNSFAPAGLTAYTIPDGVTSIGNNAFRSCSGLTNVAIPNGITEIGELAFESCRSLTSIIIPNSMTEIGHCVFANCSGLTAFYGKFASSDNRCLIVDGRLIAFAPAGLTSYTIPDSVTSIGNSAFSNCSSLTNVAIPDGITEIEGWAFSSCFNLTNITIPDGVTSIGRAAFQLCSGLTSVYCKAKTPPSVGEDTFSNYTKPLYVPTGSKAAYAAADEWKKFSNIFEMD